MQSLAGPSEEGKLSLEDLREYAIAHGEPKQTSAKQELYEAMINMYIYHCQVAKLL